MNHKLSIIIPYYNGESHFQKLIISISNSIKLVDSSFSFELIVIIDSIETNIEFVGDILLDFTKDLSNVHVHITKNIKNLGVAMSRNIGLSIASGDFIHLIDQDDTIEHSFYAIIIAQLNNYNFILVNGNVYYENCEFKKHKLYYLKQKFYLNNLVSNDFIRSPGQVVFSKELVSNIKFPETVLFKGADDRFFWFNLFFQNQKAIKPIYIHNPLYNAYIHNDNYSADKINLRKSALENWDIFLNQNKPDKKLFRLINFNILSLRFSANVKQNQFDQFIGLVFRILYFLEPNKIIRYLYKRFFINL